MALTKFIKNKFFLILLTVALALTVMCTSLSVMGYGTIVADGANIVTFPFRWCFGKIGDGFEGIGKYFQSIDKLTEENNELQSRVDELERELEKQGYAEDENSQLRKYLNIENPQIKYNYIDANVTSNSSQNYLTVFTLDRGSVDGIKVGMPVVDNNGLVGKVSEVALFSCKVTTLIENSSSLGIYIARSGESGILTGSFTLKNGGEAEGRQFSGDADIEQGDLVLTSGSGSIYPRGLCVGTVKEVTKDNNSRTKSVTVEIAADFENINKVLIISSWESSVEETSQEEAAE